MMEAARTSETLVNFYQTTRRFNPEDSHLHENRTFTFCSAHEEYKLNTKAAGSFLLSANFLSKINDFEKKLVIHKKLQIKFTLKIKFFSLTALFPCVSV
jgi:hypothetical protein